MNFSKPMDWKRSLSRLTGPTGALIGKIKSTKARASATRPSFGISGRVMNAASRRWSAPPRLKIQNISQAGCPGKITIATNMAGRGTDIVLGGNVEKQASLIENDESLSVEEKT